MNSCFVHVKSGKWKGSGRWDPPPIRLQKKVTDIAHELAFERLKQLMEKELTRAHAPQGNHASAIEMLCDSLTNKLLSPLDPMFTAHHFNRENESGGYRYQTRIHIRNNEPVTPGLVFIGPDQSSYDETRTLTEPFITEPLTSVEIVAVSAQWPRQLWLHSYLAENRRPLHVSQSFVTGERSNAESFSGVRASSWLPPERNAIVIDDLDPGFSVATTPNPENTGGFWWNRYGPQIAFDAGLPEFRRMSSRPRPGEWYRESVPWAWGKYRHTLVLASAGDSTEAGAFSAMLPAAGHWRLATSEPTKLSSAEGTSSNGSSSTGVRLILVGTPWAHSTFAKVSDQS